MRAGPGRLESVSSNGFPVPLAALGGTAGCSDSEPVTQRPHPSPPSFPRPPPRSARRPKGTQPVRLLNRNSQDKRTKRRGPHRIPFRSRLCTHSCAGPEPCVQNCARPHLALQSQALFVSLSTPPDLRDPALPLLQLLGPRGSAPTLSL